jgi:aminopeptidase-like protein
MLELVKELCGFATGVVADGNSGLFARIADELPLEMFRFKSGDSYNGWVIPDNWRVRHAKVFCDGVEVFDGRADTLGVGRYSKSFSGEMGWDELSRHLVTNPHLPEAYMFHCMWQYRPWDADWALCVPHKTYRELPADRRYRVELKTEFEPGEMSVAHHHKQGRSDKIIVFNSNTCHPHMANDGFAGTAVLIRLFQWLAPRDTFYSYRLVLGPEHLGSVFYLRDLPRSEVDRMVCGVFEEMPGTHGAIKVTSTFNGGHKIDLAFANALKHYAKAFKQVPWRQGAGNDETVWEAPGYEVPFVEMTRCEDQFAPYAEYHSSMDTPDIMIPGQLDEMLDVLKHVVLTLENDASVQRRFNGLICLSNPKFDLYMERPDPTIIKNLTDDAEKWGHLLDCLFRYMDGTMTILEIAERHEVPFERLHSYLKRFADKGLVDLEFSPCVRSVPARVPEQNTGRMPC